MKKLTIILTLFLLLNTGCSQILSFSPERAAVQAVLERPDANFQMDRASVSVLQTQPVGDAVLALVAYSGLRSGAKEQCNFVYVVERGRLGWRSSGGGGGCQPAAQLPGPVGIGSGWNGGGDNQPGYSHASGLVHQEEVAAVEVTWDDGETQTVPVVNGSYLAGRTGQHTPASVQALDAQGQEVFAWSPPEPPPGKIEPTAVP